MSNLSIEQMMSMSDADYMNAAQLEAFRHRLEIRKEELRNNLDEYAHQLGAHENVSDPADRATQEEERTGLFRLRDRDAFELAKVISALARIDEGEFGFCCNTGEPIGVARLWANPTATLTIAAQERHERVSRQYA